MRDKVIDNIMFKIKKENNTLDDVKYAEIRYGLQGLYTLITKSVVTIILAFILNIFYEFIISLLFYIPLRSLGFGTHAKSNIHCWIFSLLFLLGLPYIFANINFSFIAKIIIWVLCFINFLIFSPADTRKRPMINKKRKLKFKIGILILCFIYLVLLINFNQVSNFILCSLVLQGLLVNPLGYIIMGEEVRFSLNDIKVFKQN